MSVATFIPEVWAAELRTAYEKALVYGNLVNRDYEGAISQAGDTVHIGHIGDPTVANYTKGTTQVVPQELTTTDTTLVVTQAKYFAFKVDDVDRRQAAGNLLTVGMRRAAYRLKDAADAYIASMYTAVDAGNVTDVVNVTTGDAAYEALVNLGVILDEDNVPSDGRWVVCPPWFTALLATSKYATNPAFAGASAAIQSGAVGELAGFRVFKSNNVPVLSGSTYAVMAGTSDAIAFADQLNNVEALRMQNEFADMVRGLHLYGAKVIEPTGLAVLKASRT